MQYRMLQLCTGVLLATGLYQTPTWAGDTRCAEPIATLAALEGRADVTGKDADGWRPVTAKEAFCPGDRIRVGAASRAAVLLANHTVMRLDALTTVSFTGPRQADNLWVELLRGVGHFISRVPRRLTVSTPYVNAGVEGTEFLVSADDSAATVSVFEGHVAATNPQGTLLLTSGQTATAQSGAAPALRVTLRPRDGLQWALHYPPVIQFDAAAFAAGTGDERQASIAQSLTRFKEGDIAAALAALDVLGTAGDDSRLLNYRASLYLAVGRIDAARADIDRALALAADDGDALALKSVIALAQNDKASALQLAQQAVNAAPRAGGPRLALSYAWQAQFDLERARAEAQQAVEIDPHNALAWARLAELHLMFGERDAALAAAQEAERLDPRLAESQSVLGFAHLSRIQLAAARQAFEKAAALDPGDPLPRLGLGLVEVREGNVAAGRQQMEVAAALDPDDALVRSYLGKAYYEEKRDARAESQFAMAKTLDPNDPTPWFYEAILEQSANRPVEALQDVQTSIALNDNRAVYRSRLLLDSDAAARGASLARIYSDLGFQQLALVEAWKSLGADPTSDSAHRFLADSYSAVPRHEVARVSEVLQAQLLQPIQARPINPSAAETSLFVLESSGPTRAAYNEFTPLFARDRIAVQANLSGGVDDTWSDETVVFGNYRQFAASFGQLHYTTDGYRPNGDFKQNIYDGFMQYDVSETTSAQVEWRRRDIDSGDVAQRFGADNFDPSLRQAFDEETARLGLRHAFTPHQTILGSFIYDRQERHDVSATDFRGLTEGYNAELQGIGQFKQNTLTVGTGRAQQRADTLFVFDFGGFILPIEDSNGDRDDYNLYVYDTFRPGPSLNITLGLSYDSLSRNLFNQATAAAISDDRKQFNPKFGLLWTVSQQTTIRLAAFRSLRRLTHANQTIEPTQIAGFNQFFDDVLGTKAKRYGIGLDHQFTADLFAGIEWTKRDNIKPVLDAGLGAVTDVPNRDMLHRAYLYKILTPRWNASAEYFFSRYTSDFIAGEADPANPVEITTQYLPLSLNYHQSGGFFSKATLNLVSQHVGFSTQNGVTNDASQFSTVDLTVGYRLPSRRTIVSLAAQNIFDRQFNFHDTSLSTETPTPLLARFRPERSLFVSVAFWF